jgi:hypothetical protein
MKRLCFLILALPLLAFGQGTKVNADNQINWGPRPWIDVTSAPYNAKGDLTDDTAAIQAAITAACNTTIGGYAQIPQLYFPPGYYGIQQPQTPSTSPALTVPCSLEFIGGGGTTPQFSTSPVADLTSITGSSPNAAPMIQFINGNTIVGITINHILIDGYNQAVQIVQGTNIHFQDAVLRAQVSGDPDNSPLVVINSLWVFFDGGVLGFNTSNPSLIKSLYDVEFLGETNSLGNICYLEFFTNVTAFGGGILYDQRSAPINGIPNQFVFRNFNIEDDANSFFTVLTSTGNGSSITGVTLENVLIDDPLNTSPQAVFNFDQAGEIASGISVLRSGGAAYAIEQSAGTVASYTVTGCNTNCSNQSVDSSGNPLGGGNAQTANGLDFVANISDPVRLATDFTENGLSEPNGTPLRLFSSGSGGYATVGADPSLGFLFNGISSHGWTAQVLQNAQESLDIGFSTTLPPTGVTATAVSGGTLANGTYYYFVSPSWGSGSCANTVVGAPSLVSSSVTTTTGNNQVTVSWMVGPTESQALTGFCVFRGTTPSVFATQTGLYVSGSGTTTVTDTGSNFGVVGNFFQYNHMAASHRFTPGFLHLSGAVNTYTDTGAANAYVVTTPITFTTIPKYFQVCFFAAHANTGSSTLNVDSTGAILIKKFGNTTALASGDIAAGQIACVQYDGTQYELQSVPGTTSSGGPTKICSGTIALGTSAIASGTKATTVTATCTGLLSTDIVTVTPNSELMSITGYIPSTNGMLTISLWPTANTINVDVANNTSASVTPGAVTLNYEVIR